MLMLFVVTVCGTLAGAMVICAVVFGAVGGASVVVVVNLLQS